MVKMSEKKNNRYYLFQKKSGIDKLRWWNLGIIYTANNGNRCYIGRSTRVVLVLPSELYLGRNRYIQIIEELGLDLGRFSVGNI